jgi:hypothetical protein
MSGVHIIPNVIESKD